MYGNRRNILLGITGSVASIKAVQLINCFLTNGYDVQVVLTESTKCFIALRDLPVTVYTDEDERSHWKTLGHSVLHIELRDWADMFLLAPLTANTLAKCSSGLADNLLTCVMRACWWENTETQKPIFFAPAMNTKMWKHPFTTEQISRLENVLNWIQIPPIAKKLACGDIGMGAMAEPENILNFVENFFSDATPRL